MNLASYCRFYGIDERCKPIMELLPSATWYLFQTKDFVLKVGYYSGTGQNSKRVDLTNLVTKACVKSGVKFRAYNDAPKGGVTGNKVKLIF